MSGRALLTPDSSPTYFERASGARIWDVDGHEYLDYILAYGPYLLGYAHPEVEAAAARMVEHGRLLSMNHPIHVQLVEALLAYFPAFDMGTFFKSGSDATTAALRIARNHTRRRLVLRCGYHGFHDWCLPEEPYVPAGLEEQVLPFDVNDPGRLDALLCEHRGEVAAVIVAPETVRPYRAEVFQALADLTQRHRTVLIMDEVKTGLRIAPGSVSARAGITPDLLVLSKALGNGHPIAALLGQRSVMSGAAHVHYSATYHGEVTAAAAAIHVLSALSRYDVQAHVERLGKRLIDGLNQVACDLAVPARAGAEPLPAMPFLRFCHASAEVNQQLETLFYREVFARGVLLHPRHLWFMSLAHRERDVADTLAVAREAMGIAASALTNQP